MGQVDNWYVTIWRLTLTYPLLDKRYLFGVFFARFRIVAASGLTVNDSDEQGDESMQERTYTALAALKLYDVAGKDNVPPDPRMLYI